MQRHLRTNRMTQTHNQNAYNSPTSIKPLRLATSIIFIACLSLDIGILGNNSSIAPTPEIEFYFSFKKWSVDACNYTFDRTMFQIIDSE